MDEKFSYDVLPYPSKFFLQMHPDRLAANARFFGLNAPDVATSSVLELGCGNGSHLIACAYAMPDARFVGVDLAESHIVDANRMAAELGLTNVVFRQMDVTAMSAKDFGTFDYVTAHGLFSWVPDFVSERVLSLCRELLNENGVGYISYVAFPGAYQRQMVQQMLRRETLGIADPVERVGEALATLRFLAENATEKETYAPVLRKELQRHSEHDMADIFHDDLSDFNRAYFFRDFAALLESNGLQFLSEAEIHAMGTHGLSAAARERVEALDDILEREQMLDFLRGRVFRQTLFCRAGIALERRPEPQVLRGFKLASSVQPQSASPDLKGNGREKFADPSGMSFEIDHPLTKALLVELGERWGGATAFDELVEAAAKRTGAEPTREDIEQTTAILFQIVRSTSVVSLYTFQPKAARELASKPRLSRLAALQLRGAQHVMTRLNLDIMIEDPVSRHLLELCDGTRNMLQLSTAVRKFATTAGNVPDRGALPRDLDAWVKASLLQLAKLGMFED